MAESAKQPAFIATFLAQVGALAAWLDTALAEAGITGAPSRRARARVLELEDEVVDICNLIAQAKPICDFAKLTTYADFDASKLFAAELAYRADSGIQDLGSGIQDDLAEIARTRKKELGGRLIAGTPLNAASLALWREMSACDTIEEIGSTVMRHAEAARYLFQTEFLRVASLVEAPAATAAASSATTLTPTATPE
jgi:hypothetical protein